MDKFVNWFPEIIVGLSYYPCGAWLGYIMYTFHRHDFDQMFVWPQLLVMLGALVTAIALAVSRHVKKQVVFIHFYLMAIAMILFLVSGLMLMFNEAFDLAAVLGGFGYGLFYVAGMAYIYIRSNSKHRTQRIALCHLSLMIGTVSSVHRFSYSAHWFNGTFVFGYFFTYSSASILLFLILNELFHGLNVYNYKTCLDEKLKAADEKKDKFTSALLPENSPHAKPSTSLQKKLTCLMILTKVMNGFMYNNFFLILTLVLQEFLIHRSQYILHYFIMVGLILGIITSLNVRVKFVFGIPILLAAIGVLAAASLVETRYFRAAAVCFWIFYFFASSASFVPDVGIMELSSLKLYEPYLAFGVILEQIPILFTILFASDLDFNEGAMWTNVIIYICLAIVLTALVFKWYPNTFQEPILQIQRNILFFSRGTGGVVLNAPPVVAVPPTNVQQPPALQPTPQYPTQGYIQGPVHYPPQYPGQYPAQYSTQHPPQFSAQLNIQNTTNPSIPPQQHPYPMQMPMMPPQNYPGYPAYPSYYPQQPPIIVGSTPKQVQYYPTYPPMYAPAKEQEASAENPTAPNLTPHTEMIAEQHRLWAQAQHPNTEENPPRPVQ